MTSGNWIVDDHDREERRQEKRNRCYCGGKFEEVSWCEASDEESNCEKCDLNPNNGPCQYLVEKDVCKECGSGRVE